MAPDPPHVYVMVVSTIPSIPRDPDQVAGGYKNVLVTLTVPHEERKNLDIFYIT